MMDFCLSLTLAPISFDKSLFELIKAKHRAANVPD